jgi:hypothetical protein
MDIQLQGVEYIDGQLAVVGSLIGSDGTTSPALFPADLAFTIGCSLIELAGLAHEREAELKQSGQVLDVNSMETEFGRRLQQRIRANRA